MQTYFLKVYGTGFQLFLLEEYAVDPNPIKVSFCAFTASLERTWYLRDFSEGVSDCELVCWMCMTGYNVVWLVMVLIHFSSWTFAC